MKKNILAIGLASLGIATSPVFAQIAGRIEILNQTGVTLSFTVLVDGTWTPVTLQTGSYRWYETSHWLWFAISSSPGSTVQYRLDPGNSYELFRFNGRSDLADRHQPLPTHTIPHLVHRSDGLYQPAPGYEWIDPTHELGNFDVRLHPGLIESDNALEPATGYVWENPDDPNDFWVVPAPGYVYASADPRDFSVRLADHGETPPPESPSPELDRTPAMNPELARDLRSAGITAGRIAAGSVIGGTAGKLVNGSPIGVIVGGLLSSTPTAGPEQDMTHQPGNPHTPDHGGNTNGGGGAGGGSGGGNGGGATDHSHGGIGGIGVVLLAVAAPPLLDGIDSKLGSRSRSSHHHHSAVAAVIEDPIRELNPLRVGWEVVVVNLFAFASPSPTVVFEVTNELPLFSVSTDDRQVRGFKFSTPRRDEHKLPIASGTISMLVFEA